MSERVYFLSDIERLLNVKAQTLRTWEKRYGIIKPFRNESNCRYYTSEQKDLITDIILLKEHGYKLKDLANWDPVDISKAARKLVNEEILIDEWLEQIVESTLQFDHNSINSIFIQAQEHYSDDCLIYKIILPLFRQFNVLSLTGTVNAMHERFLGHIVKNQIERLGKNAKSDRDRQVILFSPDSSQKEYLLYLIKYLLNQFNYDVTYIGCGVSPFEFRKVVHELSFRKVVILLSEQMFNVDLGIYTQRIHESYGSQRINLIIHPPIKHHPDEQFPVPVFEGIRTYAQYLKAKTTNVKTQALKSNI